MKVPTALLAEVNYEATVVAELSVRNRYLPPPLADWALRGQSTELANRLKTRMRREFDPFPHDSVLARKTGRGSRPLPYMALEDRLVYRALVNVLAARLPTVPGRDDYDAFVSAPLSVDDCRYVLKADVAAFYQYVDHERLIDEVVAQTGDDLAITAIVDLLEAGSGRRFGLPQMHSSSDVLADTYVDPIRRVLVRSGYTVFRYADDFRVACANYSEALSSLELIERSAFDLGLVLNEGKTSSPLRATYEESLSEVARAERTLFALLKAEGMTIDEFFTSSSDFYGDEQRRVRFGDEVQLPALPGAGHDEGDLAQGADEADVPTPEQIEVAARVMELWNTDAGEPYEWSATVWSALLRKSLFALEIAGDLRAVPSAIGLLVQEPHLTPQVCNYLIAVGQEQPEQVHSVLDELCDNDIVSVWQVLWVAFLAGSVAADTQHMRHLGWLSRQVDDAHDAVSAQAALALARRRALTVEVGARAYARAPQAHRPTVALALAAAHGAAGSEFAYDDQVEGWLADWASTQTWGKPLRRGPVTRRRRTQR